MIISIYPHSIILHKGEKLNYSSKFLNKHSHKEFSKADEVNVHKVLFMSITSTVNIKQVALIAAYMYAHTQT